MSENICVKSTLSTLMPLCLHPSPKSKIHCTYNVHDIETQLNYKTIIISRHDKIPHPQFESSKANPSTTPTFLARVFPPCGSVTCLCSGSQGSCAFTSRYCIFHSTT